MAKETLLESDIAAGARFIEALDEDGEAVDTALWFYYPDLSQWKLLIASPAFEKDRPTSSYTKVSKLLSNEDEVGRSISISDIKILTAKDPMRRLLKGIIRTGKSLDRIRMTSNILNGIYVEDALVYRNV